MMSIMKHLVITVSPDSSIELLKVFADVIVLDKDPLPSKIPYYETIYIRSHFGQDATLPQAFRKEIEDVVKRAKIENPSIKFIDGTDTVDKILSAEDKWLQYESFGDLMPRTVLFNQKENVLDFKRPVFKNRFSSHGNGVTWEMKNVTDPTNSWVIQESLDISEELRVYIINRQVYPIGAIRQSKNQDQNTQAIDSRHLAQSEIAFSEKVTKHARRMDIMGIDIARTADGKLYLMEVNRSPGFGKFNELTGINLASSLYYGENSID